MIVIKLSLCSVLFVKITCISLVWPGFCRFLTQNVTWQILLYLFLFTVGLPVLYLYKNSVPYRRGFFCNDDSLRYPYKENTISDDLLLLVGFLLPFVVVSTFTFWSCKIKFSCPLLFCNILGIYSLDSSQNSYCLVWHTFKGYACPIFKIKRDIRYNIELRYAMQKSYKTSQILKVQRFRVSLWLIG